LQVVGVDGWKGRWVAVIVDADGRFAGAQVFGDVGMVSSRFPDAAAIGIDMPIGVAPAGARSADRLAREFVRPRGSSVFTAPSATDLQADSHAAAIAAARAAGHGAISAQAYGLRGAIRAVEASARADGRIWEVHPEVCFKAMAGKPLLYGKKSWAGMWMRLELLGSAGIELPSSLGDADVVGIDDVLDAAAAAWSALRIASGKALSLPSPPERIDDRDVAIWY
jgi:predicted RNase H-like nuclease